MCSAGLFRDTGVTGTVPTTLVGQQDALWFPSASSGGSGGTIDVTFTWKILCVNQSQTLHPWAAAKSGQKYKYTGLCVFYHLSSVHDLPGAEQVGFSDIDAGRDGWTSYVEPHLYQ